jgi:NTP pyrophosphatase (non-canonical NTP hydrolase)
MTTPQKSANELMNEIGEWADKNFKVHMPDYGIVEELGEIVHCILKRAQGIRGFDKDEVYVPALKDAFADLMIYLLHLCFKYKVALSFDSYKMWMGEARMSDRLAMRQAMRYAGLLMEYSEITSVSDDNAIFRVPAQCLCNVAIIWGHQLGIDVVECTHDVWAKNVSKRNWEDNPEDADKKVLNEP